MPFSIVANSFNGSS